MSLRLLANSFHIIMTFILVFLNQALGSQIHIFSTVGVEKSYPHIQMDLLPLIPECKFFASRKPAVGVSDPNLNLTAFDY